MFLAIREMRRARTRFATLAAAIGLLMFLILAQQAIQDGLIKAFVGAIETQSAPALAFAVDAQRTLQGSVLTPELERAVRSVDGVGATGRIGQGTFTTRTAGESGSGDAAIIGYDDPALGAPEKLSSGRLPEAPGEAVGSATDFELGDRVRPIGPGGEEGAELEVVGLAEGAQLQVTPTLFVAWEDYARAVRATNPDAGRVLPSALGLRPREGLGASELTERINQLVPDAEALTRERAAEESPGVAQVRQSFQVIFLLFGLVVPLVTGLFFLILTLQKAPALTLLRAIGARSGVLVRSLLLQVLLVVGAGLALGIALYLPLSRMTLGDVALSFDGGAVALWAFVLLALGLLSAVVSARRVLAIDPIEATSGGGRV